MAPYYIYYEGWNVYWYGRFLSTFSPGYAFVASESESEYEVKVHLTIEAQTAHHERSNRYTVPTQLNKTEPR